MTQPYNTEYYEDMSLYQLRRLHRVKEIEYERHTTREILTYQLCRDMLWDMYFQAPHKMTADELRLFCSHIGVHIPPGDASATKLHVWIKLMFTLKLSL